MNGMRPNNHHQMPPNNFPRPRHRNNNFRNTNGGGDSFGNHRNKHNFRGPHHNNRFPHPNNHNRGPPHRDGPRGNQPPHSGGGGGNHDNPAGLKRKSPAPQDSYMPKSRGRGRVVNGNKLKLQDLNPPKPGEKHPPPPGEEVPDLEGAREEKELAQEKLYYSEFPALGDKSPPKLKQKFKPSHVHVPVVGQQIPILGANGGESPIPTVVTQATSPPFLMPVRGGISGSIGMPRYNFPPPIVPNGLPIPVQLSTATQRPAAPFEPMDQFSVSFFLYFCKKYCNNY